MAYRSLRQFAERLESAGELSRITAKVSPRLEITEIADRMVKSGGKALLFEQTGTEFPLLINMFASDRRICMAFGIDELSEIERSMERLMKELMSPKQRFMDKLKVIPVLQEIASWMPRVTGGRGACQEVVMDKPDLGRLPVLTCWPADGGPFITLPGVHTRCPETGNRNLGMYRMQVFAPDMTGMHWHLHKGSANHFNRYRELGRRMPVSVTLGGDPVYIYAATAPLPEHIDEYMLAGFLRKKRVNLVRCLTNDLEVPADADFVIEGYVDPAEGPILEGPFGDHTGFYSLADYFPKFHVTCITHRRDAIYPATIVGVPPQEDGWIGKATERIFLFPLKTTVAPELTDMHMPVEGVFHNITLVSIKKSYPGQAPKIMNAMWGAGQMMFNKIMAVTDHDTDLKDYKTLARIISERTDPVADVHLARGPVDILDHASSAYAYGSKLGIDATRKISGEGPSGKPVNGPSIVDVKRIRETFPEVTAVNAGLLVEGISMVLITIRKSRKQHTRYLAGEILKMNLVSNVKCIVFTDHPLDLSSPARLVWIVANNIDPVRDCFRIDEQPGEPYPLLFIDGTVKTAGLDGFTREWPNIILMDPAVIEQVDQRWNQLGLGPLIPSPSLPLQPFSNSLAAVYRGNDRGE